MKKEDFLKTVINSYTFSGESILAGSAVIGDDYERPAPRQREEESSFEKIMKSPVTKSIAVEITRGILGVLGFRSTARRSSTRRYR